MKERLNTPYNFNGGTAGSPANPTTYTDTTAEFTLSNPTRTGYTFTGWTGTDLDEATTTVTIEQGSTGDREYVANWSIRSYSISYTLNGGTLPIAKPTGYTVQTITFNLVNPTKTGYTFAGWTGTDLDEPTITVIIPNGSTGNRTYTATWQ